MHAEMTKISTCQKMQTDRWMDGFSALYSRDSVIIAEIMPIATALIFYS